MGKIEKSFTDIAQHPICPCISAACPLVSANKPLSGKAN